MARTLRVLVGMVAMLMGGLAAEGQALRPTPVDGARSAGPAAAPRMVTPTHLNARGSDDYHVFYPENRARSGIPLGGIGTGFVELRADGTFHNWMIANNQPKGVGDVLDFRSRGKLDRDENEAILFFVLRYQVEGERPAMRILSMQRSEDEAGVHQYHIRYIFPYLTAVDRIESSAQFPFVRFRFTDEAMPLDVEMEAFSSFVPGDLTDASIPGASFRFRVTATGERPVDATLICVARNLVGYNSRALLRAAPSADDTGTIVKMMADHVDPRQTSWGTMAIGVNDPEATWYLGWRHQHPVFPWMIRNAELPDYDDTFGKRAFLESRGIDPETDDRFAWVPDTGGRVRRDGDVQVTEAISYNSLATYRKLTPGKAWAPVFALGWHFPNAYAGRAQFDKALEAPLDAKADVAAAPGWVGHSYANRYDDAEQVVRDLLRRQAALYQRTKAFVDAMYESDLPPFATDLANAQLTCLLAITTLHKDGSFGISDDLHQTLWGAQAGHNPDVSVYASPMILSLFPELHRDMVDFWAERYARQLKARPDKTVSGKTDRPMDFINTAMTHWHWTGDAAARDRWYDTLQAVLEASIADADTNGDGVPELHGGNSTYDNLVQWNLSAWLAAKHCSTLVLLEAEATRRGDDAFAARCADLLARTRSVVDEHLWNGNYYDFYSDYDNTYPQPHRWTDRRGRQRTERRYLAPHLCFADQLFGQTWLNMTDREPVFGDFGRQRSALRCIYRYNLEPTIGLINLRDPKMPETFGMMAIQPYGGIDQPNVTFTGVGSATAATMLYAGLYDEAMACLLPLHRRHRKNDFYFNHQEAFNHYLRGMSSWNVLHAAPGLSIVDGTDYRFDPKVPGARRLFVTMPGFAGTMRIADGAVTVAAVAGDWTFRRIDLPAAAVADEKPTLTVDGKPMPVRTERSVGRLIVRSDAAVRLAEGMKLEIR